MDHHTDIRSDASLVTLVLAGERETFGPLLLRHLDQLGAVAHYRDWGHDGFTAIMDLHTPGASEDTLVLLPRVRGGARRLAGCIAVSPARVW